MKIPTIFRRLLALLVIPAAIWISGCSDDEEPIEYVHAGSFTITGFYVGAAEGGHITILVDRWAEKRSSGTRSPLRPANDFPVGLHVTLRPDDGGAPIQMVGYEGNGGMWAEGGGYQFSQGFFSTMEGRFGGYVYSPKGTAYCLGLVGSADSIETYLGTFSGDSLSGRWCFVAPDTFATQLDPAATGLLGYAMDSDSRHLYGFDGSYTPSDTAYAVEVSGPLSGPLIGSWYGSGTLTSDKSFASGSSDIGAWSATQYVPPSP
ncbi:MAG TPA: hypothetical protein VLA89_02645 [Gemmatimonadales bacterium]|nr:hypothetical protein [Gemmatimonadales bacterium]